MVKAVSEVMFRLQKGGLPAVWRWLEDRLGDRKADRKFGIDTWHRRSSKELGHLSPELVNYQAISYRDLHEILSSLSIAKDDVLLDLGSGEGRILCAAATYPFGSVIGVEISAELCAVAQRNVERVRHKFLCPDVQVVNCDAREYSVSPQVNVIILFNPFSGTALQGALERVEESLQKHPRKLKLLFYGTVSTFTFFEAAQAHTWLSFQSETVLSTGALVLRYLASGG